jgi:tetratricopeptide (TPR) repeat protein
MKDQVHLSTARSLLERAESALEATRFQEAAATAAQALEMARGNDDGPTAGRCLALLAIEHYRVGRLEQAYSAACNAHGLLTRPLDASARLRAMNIRALVLRNVGDESSAIEIWRQALKSVSGGWASHGRSTVQFNLANMLIKHGECEEAIRCLSQSEVLARQSPEPAIDHAVAASDLAYAHVQYADHLARAGRSAEAQAQLKHAAIMLPPLDPSGWHSFCVREIRCLWTQVEVLSAIGSISKARAGAAAGLRVARREPPYLANALLALSGLYKRNAQMQRAIHCERRALPILRALGIENEVVGAVGRLATLYSECGDHAQALQLRKDITVRVAAKHAERDAISRRLAAIEREVETQLADANGKIVHAQQLSIIGRLIGQIHHALQAPIERTRQLCVLALRAHERALVDSSPAPGMSALLTAISQSVDEAANLSRQLKIYAYRSSPVTTTVSIDTSLREVWVTLNPHVSAHPRELRVVGDASLHVRADPQRLGVLLTLMLIELVKKQSSSAATVVVTANIEAATPGNVALVMNSELPGNVGNEDGSTVSLIETLCKEIAVEMGATLSCTHPGGTLLRCTLVMPDADDSAADRKR